MTRVPVRNLVIDVTNAGNCICGLSSPEKKYPLSAWNVAHILPMQTRLCDSDELYVVQRESGLTTKEEI